MKKKLILLFAGVVMAVFSLGCGGGEQVVSDDQQATAPVAVTDDSALAQEPSIRNDEAGDYLKVVNFAFDKDDISADAAAILKENADYLSQNLSLNVVIEGHCDNRGTTAYNLALGQRRAAKVKDYYVKQLNVAPERIATISYGEEKPVDSENNESAWAKNRRAETKVLTSSAQ
ncbi:MAG: OmpA family protein [Elusimicrobiota bacterium]|nr:OmpA family protein [Elusimicrobiota bacterium]